MSLAALALTVAFQQTPAPPDRSGEPQLKKLLQWTKSLDQVHVVILRRLRENALQPMSAGDDTDIWIAGGKLRVEQSGYWGDAMTIVFDGKSVMTDAASDYSPVTLEDPGKTFMETFKTFSFEQNLTPFFYMLQGPPALDAMVAKEESVIDEDAGVGRRDVAFKSKLFGGTKLFYRPTKNGPKLELIQFDNLAWLNDQYTKYPDWSNPPDPGTLSKHFILIEPWKPISAMLSTVPPVGRSVQDNRKKKPPTG